MTLIAQITDLHVRPRGQPCYRVVETNLMADRAVRALKALDPAPDAVVITGDLVDSADRREYAEVQRLLSKLPFPVFVLPGNHDSTVEMRERLAGLGPLERGSPDKMHYAVRIGELRLIALDSSVPGKGHGALGPAQIDWLDATLGEDDRPTLVALHHPPARIGIAHMDAIGLTDTAAFAAVISRHSHVARVLCGHVHRPIVTGFAGTIMTLAPSTAHQVVLDLSDNGPAEFILEPPAYFLHAYAQDTGVVTHTAYVDTYPGPYPFWADEGVSWPGY